ncbi:MAG TPA: ABC transporter permease subunit [Symbiobacteriaceae bacterium]|jgi:ABC-type transport system involved in multi-copper enzyme maturation permease subunit
MNKQAVWAIAWKDMRAITANIQVWLPMVIIPLVLGIVIPTAFVGLLAHFGMGSMNNTDQMVKWVERIPPSALKSTLIGLPSLVHQVAYLVGNYLFAPFFLLIPLMTASVISADSFAGEKERSTLETLLFAPVDLFSLFLGKALAAFVPAVGLSFGTFVLCAISLNAAGWSLFHGLFFPRWNWLPLMLLVIPMVSLLTIFVTVYVSARSTTFQGAYQSGALLVLPAILLLFGQVSGLLLLDTGLVTVIGLVLAVINGALLWQLTRHMDRGYLFESQIK